MNRTLLALLAATVLTLPGLALAASHEHGAMKHGSSHDMKGHDGHGDMKMDSSMQMLPMQTVDGVSATVHIKDVKAVMAKMGMKHTHHFMVVLENDANGEQIVPQVIAVKIVDPSGKEGEAIALPSMQGHSGADVILAAPGAYVFKVAAKLPDGKKVQFEFKHVLK
jgi:hypothetical protein